MENLFKYATKELSQDAFLLWLFTNYDCNQTDVKNFSRQLIVSLINHYNSNKIIPDVSSITNLQYYKQFKDIDILITFKYYNEDYLICIEDKVGSTQHDNQLEKYVDIVNWNFSKINPKNRVFIYYKTNYIDKIEINKISQINNNLRKNKKNTWEIFKLKDMLELFCNFIQKNGEIENEVLNYYYEYINGINNYCNDFNKWSLNRWHEFFDNFNILNDNVEKGIGVYRNQYVYMYLLKKGHTFDFPCIEIRSREVKNNKIQLNLVTYHMNDISIQSINKSIIVNDIKYKFPTFRSTNYKNLIGKDFFSISGNSENDLIKALNDICKRLW